MNNMYHEISDGIYITSETTDEAGSFPAYHSHNVYEIYILTSGRRDMYVGTGTYAARAGDAGLIPPHMPHRSCGKTPYSGICVEFSDGYLEGLTASERDEVREGFKKRVVPIDTAALGDPAGGKREYLLTLAGLISAGRDTADERRTESDLSPIGNYIQEHYRELRGLDAIAYRFGISKSYLCRVFKKQTGITVIEYMNRLRVQHAVKLLQETELSVNEIAAASGFESVIYFNRVFKRVRGVTPKEERKKSRENWSFAAAENVCSI